jgi:small subunit ribosomal protein S3
MSLLYSNFSEKIRSYINTISKANYISNVKIFRNGLNDQIQVNIETGKPGILVGDLGNGLKDLLKNLKKLLPENRQLTIKVFEVEKVDLEAQLLANLVADQLEKRIAFRRAIRTALQRAQKENVNGIKIQVSGRLNGAEIARSEWIREGRVPLQTLRADIDYATTEANTIYGVLGIKVWLFKSEILAK